MHAKDGQTVSLVVPQFGIGAQRCVSTPLNESLSRTEMALAGICWQYLAALPKAIIVLSKRSVDCSRRCRFERW